MDVDSLQNMSFIPPKPLPPKSFAMYIVGAPGSGKSNLWQALLLSHPTKKRPDKPRYYYRAFDRVELISGSLQTLPKQLLSKIPDEQQHNKYSDALLTDLVDEMREDENLNNLIVMDDVIRDLTRSHILSKCILNRRHCTHDSGKDNHGGLSMMVTSQKYSLLPLEMRNAMSHVIIFRSQNSTEVNRLKEELMGDLNKDQQDELLELAWSQPYSFLMIAVNAPRSERYFVKFDKVVIE
jgi:GTPase SAR1 family protein